MDNKIFKEMVETIVVKCTNCQTCEYRTEPHCTDFLSAEKLYNAGYRKIPEGAVVLTGTETEERLEDLLIEFDEMSFYPATLMPNAEECAREWKRKLIYAIRKFSIETAKKLAESLKEETAHVIHEMGESPVDKIYKKIREELNEKLG